MFDMKNNIVKVFLWNREVGSLYWDNHSNRAVFAFHSDFLQEGIEVAPLSASVFSAASRRPIVGSKNRLYQGLPPFIADSLPDRWGNLVFESWAKAQRLKSSDLTPVEKLAFIGNRGMGALEFRPAVAIEKLTDNLQLNSLYTLAKRIFEERSEVSILPEESLTMQSLYAVGTSAGGQHPKAIIAIHPETQEIRSGQIDYPGFKYYILKFAEDSYFPMTNIEMAYYQMAKDMGIDMMPSRLLKVEGKQHFLTERFDRQEGKRIHTLTLAAINEDAHSYEDLMNTARRLRVSQQEQQQLFLRIVMNLWGGNVDDHQKNFAFMLQEGGTWQITPAYDVTFTTNLDTMGYDNNHVFSLCGKVNDFTEEDLLRFASDNSIKRPKAILDKVATVLSHCWEYLTAQHVDRYWADRIEKHIASLLPERYRDVMTHYQPTPVADFQTPTGQFVSNIHWHETYGHDLHLYADVDGVTKRYIFGHRSAEYKQIADLGWVHMPEDKVREYVIRYLL